MRLFTLQTLKYFTMQNLIVNHDSLDSRNDLDEEHSSLNDNTSNTCTSTTASKIMNAFEMLCKLEILPMSFQNDRQFQCALLQMQQRATSKCFPTFHRACIVHCMIELFHVKLKKVWNMSKKIINEVFSSYPECKE